MKYLLAVLMLAAPARSAEIVLYGTPTAVAVSSNAYVSVISSVTRNGYPSIIVKNPSSNATLGEVFGHVGGCTSTAVSTSSVLGPFSFNRGDAAQEIELTEPSCLWVASRSTQTITIQAIRRK
jgi:hypothetical protein